MKKCVTCGKTYDDDYYLPYGNMARFTTQDGTAPICLSCVAVDIDRKDLFTIDKLCQYLDVPFNPNRWIEMEVKYEKLGPLLIDYVQEMRSGQYAECDWNAQNKMWEKCREYGTLSDELTALHNDLLIYLRKKWGHIDGFTLDEYMRMEEYERHTLSHYPFKDEARRDMVRKLAKLSAIADHCIAEGDNKEATTVLQSYNTLMKELGISTQTTSDENTIESLSELVAYLEKSGFLLNYRVSENRDIVDKTISNMEQYVRRLFMDSNETVNEMYNAAKVAEESGTTMDDEDIEQLYDTQEAETDISDPLDEEELEAMFKEVDDEYK